MKSWFQLFRLHNAVIAAAGTWLGWFSLRDVRSGVAVAVWGSLSMALLTAAGNADNDVCDLEADRINQPERPLPSNVLSVLSVRITAFVLYVLGIIAAFQVSAKHSILAAVMAALLLAYNRKLKGFPLVGNLAVSLLCALAIYFPEFPQWIHNTLTVCAFAFWATFTREMVKDIEDQTGDGVVGLKTFPLVFGTLVARKLAFVFTAILLASLPLPVVFFGYHWPYLTSVTVLAAPFLVLLLMELSKSGADYRRCQRYLKWMMLGGMLSLLVGALT
jgi:4-hydroxybenzoate polyprenyltransferase